MGNIVNEAKLLIEIEEITDYWIRIKRKPTNFYNKFAELLLEFNQVYCLGYSYFGYIKAWCHWLNDLCIDGWSSVYLVEYLKGNSFLYYQKYFKKYESMHLTELRRHRENESRNVTSLLKKTKNAVNRYSKTEVVRVDLAYLKKFHSKVDIELVYKDLLVLRTLLSERSKPLHDLIEYSWALEQGCDKGYHIHLALFFNGHRRQKGWAIADMVGKLWMNITKNLGSYFNCHDTNQVERYIQLGRLGIGRIHREDPIQVRKMLDAIKYLVKPEKEAQHLRVKLMPKMRTFQ